MQIAELATAFDRVKQSIANLDTLIKQGGQNFNEAQIETCRDLNDKFTAESETAALKVIEFLARPEPSAEPAPEPTIPQGSELKPGQVVSLDGKEHVMGPDGKFYPKATSKPAAGQPDQISQAHDPIMQSVIDATQVSSLAVPASAKAGSAASGNPGVLTHQTGEKEDLGLKGDVIGQITSEGDEQTHFTSDGSRVIKDSAPGEGLKMLTVDPGARVDDPGEAFAALQNGDMAHDFKGSITADAPADTAAVASGEQEVLKPVGVTGEIGVVTGTTIADVPETSTLIEHPTDKA